VVFAHTAVDGHLARPQQVAQGADQRGVNHIAVAEGGEFRQMLDNL